MELEQCILEVLNTAGFESIREPHKFTSMLYDVSHDSIKNWEILSSILNNGSFLRCFSSLDGSSSKAINDSEDSARQLLSSRPFSESWIEEVCRSFASAINQEALSDQQCKSIQFIGTSSPT